MTSARAFLIVMDSVGIGGAPDADQFFCGDVPDTGANTVGHIARARPLLMPNLDRLGLGAAIDLASGATAPGLGATPQGIWGAATEISPGKDTPSGHWEMAGVPVPWEWHYFPDTTPAFPDEVTRRICELAGTEGILANCHASGTQVIEDFGAEHIRSGWPICYTSVDSVLQIAAHEDHFGLQRLIDLCQGIAPMLHQMKVGRAIARPFIGEKPGEFTRTSNRRDFAIAPPQDTILDIASAAGRVTHAIGKIGDIFSHRGVTHLHKGKSDADLGEHLIRLGKEAEFGSLTFANFVEFDTNYGHRRDVAGYAAQLEWFDGVAGRFLETLGPGDLAIFTADHGNDPSWTGTDHTRERVPVLGHGLGARDIGHVAFSDIGASVMAHLGLPATYRGTSFL
ncbi:phosphopentomutase [Paracoccus fistulariae]|uniref:Phosphopentomutase n=1 Tax=Paracoccus fistulariae TaxID=658446 RepID=A0ABY7SJJ4_9RHOB|nr:phosphopentomutase [Paracoccus fistulariae]MDB6180587.1 phosphopentomutase [Paracoccus fistulariae]WCR07175.1 phosphopentomutase [Paracoccus fistulariae]